MKRLLATLVAGTFAVVALAAFAQGAPSPAMQKENTKDPKGAAAAYQNPAAEQTQAQKSQAGAAEVAKSTAPRQKSGYDEKAAQRLVSTGTDPDKARANVAASKAQSAKREKVPDIKKLTKEQRAELLRQLQKESTP